MPVAPELGIHFGNDDEVEEPWGDGLFAARAHVRLSSLIWLHRADDDGLSHSSSEEAPHDEGNDDEDEDDHEQHIQCRLVLFAERIESHVPQW